MTNFALLQTDIHYADPPANHRRVRALFEEAMARIPRPDVVVLPEDWSSAFSIEMFHRIEEHLEEPNGPSLSLLQKLAADYSVWVVGGSINIRYPDGNRNTVFLIDRKGEVVGDYSKMHLYSSGEEDIAFLHGDKSPVYSTEIGKMGLMVCYDIRFPELSTVYALRGAEILVVVSNFPDPKLSHWRTLLIARAIENQMFVVACNRVGASPLGTYCGHSMIVDPWGEVIAEGGGDEEIVYGGLNLELIPEVRGMIAKFRDRRPSSYGRELVEPSR